jgi:hypothetical protein
MKITRISCMSGCSQPTGGVQINQVCVGLRQLRDVPTAAHKAVPLRAPGCSLAGDPRIVPRCWCNVSAQRDGAAGSAVRRPTYTGPIPGHRPARPGHRRLLPQRRNLAAARRFFTQALRAGTVPAEVTTDRAPAYPRILDELIPSALHHRALRQQLRRD